LPDVRTSQVRQLPLSGTSPGQQRPCLGQLVCSGLPHLRSKGRWMRIRPALAATALTAALAVGIAGAPAQAADADKDIRTTSVLAPTGATASWHTLDE